MQCIYNLLVFTQTHTKMHQLRCLWILLFIGGNQHRDYSNNMRVGICHCIILYYRGWCFWFCATQKTELISLATNSLLQVCLVQVWRKQKSDPSKCTCCWMVKILCETKYLTLTVHVCPFHDNIWGLLIIHCLWVLLNHILCDIGRSIWFVWAVKTECASISYM